MKSTSLMILSLFLITATFSNNLKASSAFYPNEGITPVLIARAITDTFPDDVVFTKVEQEAEFPGGTAAWAEYISGEIQKDLKKFTAEDYGTCVIKFIVDKKGRVSNVEASTMRDTRLAKVAIKAIKNGPEWIPAEQSGRKVKAYRLQPITLKNPGKESKAEK